MLNLLKNVFASLNAHDVRYLFTSGIEDVQALQSDE